ncbi:MAG: hypothetical protein AB7P76_12090 [Candidatus Melainabacteria bacterium]
MHTSFHRLLNPPLPLHSPAPVHFGAKNDDAKNAAKKRLEKAISAYEKALAALPKGGVGANQKQQTRLATSEAELTAAQAAWDELNK